MSMYTQQKEELKLAMKERISSLRALSGCERPSKQHNNSNDNEVDSLDNNSIIKQEQTSETEQKEEDEDDDGFESSVDVVQDCEVVDLQAKLEYVDSVLALIHVIDASLNKATEMLKSKYASDVVEALRFLAKAVNFNIQGSLKLFAR
jgi:hypothetical protein